MKLFILLMLFPLALKSEVIKVMIIDSGIDLTSPAITKFITTPAIHEEYLYLEHGTHVAGTVIYGPMKYEGDYADEVCEEVQVTSCQVFKKEDQSASETTSRISECLTYAIKNNYNYINMSLCGAAPNRDEYDLLVEASNNGIKLVAAAGNNNENLTKHKYYPAAYIYDHYSYSYDVKVKKIENLVSVMAINRKGEKYSKSNYGEGLIEELGVEILSFVFGGKLSRYDGTSMAAAVHTHKLVKRHCELLREKPIKTLPRAI
jgi:cell wall-associated protease